MLEGTASFCKVRSFLPCIPGNAVSLSSSCNTPQPQRWTMIAAASECLDVWVRGSISLGSSVGVRRPVSLFLKQNLSIELKLLYSWAYRGCDPANSWDGLKVSFPLSWCQFTGFFFMTLISSEATFYLAPILYMLLFW
jgi:hypothetical protein